MQTEAVMRPQAAIHFHTHLKIFPAEFAGVRTRREGKRPAHPQGVPEFVGCMPDILLRDKVLCDRPTLHMAAENQLRFKLALLLHSRFRIRYREIGLSVRSYHLKQGPVGAVDILKLNVE